MEYVYSAMDTEKKVVKGVIEAKDDADFFRYLESKELYCLEHHIKGSGASNIDGSSGYRFKMKDLSSFCREFYVLNRSGVDVRRAFLLLAEKADDKKKKACLLSINENISKGMSLADAMAKEKKAFPGLMIAMVSAGETSGMLPDVISNLADYYEKEFRTRGKVQSMMIYPAILFILLVAVVLGLFTLVLPNFFAVFEGSEVPRITEIVMNMSNFLIVNWKLLLIMVICVVIAVKIFSTTEFGKYSFAKLKCKFPYLGKLQMITYTSRFCSTLSVLVRTGIPLLDAISICSATLGNVYLEKILLSVSEEIAMGHSLSFALRANNLFNDGILWSMISSGEETGTLDEVLIEMSEHYEAASDMAVEKMLKVLEPVMILIIGVVVGGVVAAVMLPMYSMYDSLS